MKDLTKYLDPSGLGVISFEDFYQGITAIRNGGQSFLPAPASIASPLPQLHRCPSLLLSHPSLMTLIPQTPFAELNVLRMLPLLFYLLFAHPVFQN